jgi:phosphoenolpyruvate carboxylase
MLLGAARPAAELPARWTDALTRASRASVTAYRALVEDPRFLGFFAEVTPIHEIARLNIASRPVRRPGEPTLHNLRAIPWVMSWTQNRANLPGWYGLHEGLQAIGPELGREMYAQWQFFRSLLDNAQMSLAKSDMLDLPRVPAPQRRAVAGRAISAADADGRPGRGDRRRRAAGGRAAARSQHRAAQPLHRPDPPHPGRAAAPLAGAERGLDALERPLLLSVQGIAAGVRNTG